MSMLSMVQHMGDDQYSHNFPHQPSSRTNLQNLLKAVNREDVEAIRRILPSVDTTYDYYFKEIQHIFFENVIDLNNMIILKDLIKAGFDVNTNNTAPLLYACANGTVDAVKILLGAGARVNSQYGAPILYASHRNKVDVVKELIKAGADVNAGKGVALKIAVENKFAKLARVLTDAGAKPNFFNIIMRRKLGDLLRAASAAE
jgi:hypothetical protein